MAIVITFGIQKGGVGKSTTSGIVGYLLSKKQKVLAIDMDSQGNLTQFLSGVDDLMEFKDRTILEGIKTGDVSPYLVNVGPNFDLVPADDFLALLPRYLLRDYHAGDPSLALARALEPVQDKYDWIILDTPPALSEQTINALAASDYVVIMFETSKFCYHAVDRFLEMIITTQDKVNPKLEVLGILRTLHDVRRIDSNAMIEMIAEKYPDLVFETVLQRKAATGRLPVYGFVDNPELSLAVEQHEEFKKEMIKRVQKLHR